MKAILVLVAVLLAGCAATPPALTAGSGHPVKATCAPAEISPNTVTLADFKVAWVLRCPFRINGSPRVAERSDGPGLAELVRQLRMPSEPTPMDTACTAQGTTLEYFALVDARGNAVKPDAPTNICGRPRQSLMDALGALRFHPYPSGNG